MVNELHVQQILLADKNSAVYDNGDGVKVDVTTGELYLVASFRVETGNYRYASRTNIPSDSLLLHDHSFTALDPSKFDGQFDIKSRVLPLLELTKTLGDSPEPILCGAGQAVRLRRILDVTVREFLPNKNDAQMIPVVGPFADPVTVLDESDDGIDFFVMIERT